MKFQCMHCQDDDDLCFVYCQDDDDCWFCVFTGCWWPFSVCIVRIMINFLCVYCQDHDDLFMWVLSRWWWPFYVCIVRMIMIFHCVYCQDGDDLSVWILMSGWWRACGHDMVRVFVLYLKKTANQITVEYLWICFPDTSRMWRVIWWESESGKLIIFLIIVFVREETKTPSE